MTLSIANKVILPTNFRLGSSLAKANRVVRPDTDEQSEGSFGPTWDDLGDLTWDDLGDTTWDDL